jgi:hypothetical protein
MCLQLEAVSQLEELIVRKISFAMIQSTGKPNNDLNSINSMQGLVVQAPNRDSGFVIHSR